MTSQGQRNILGIKTGVAIVVLPLGYELVISKTYPESIRPVLQLVHSTCIHFDISYICNERRITRY